MLVNILLFVFLISVGFAFSHGDYLIRKKKVPMKLYLNNGPEILGTDHSQNIHQMKLQLTKIEINVL